jgi:glycosyltransferase involved in cell wall biosynthesis
MALLAGALTGRPVVATVAGSDLNQAAYQPVAGRVVRFTLRRVHTLMAPGSQLAQRAVELGVPQECVRLLMGHSGIDLSQFTGGRVGRCASIRGGSKALDRAVQYGEDSPVVLYVGNLSPPKRVDVVLRAMSRVVDSLPDARLLLVGDGELRMELESLVSELGIGQAVEFLGARPHDEIPGWMRQADVLVHCSEHEGLPMVIMEAFGCGLPVVAAGVGGIPDLVREGETGYLLDTGDDMGFADKLIKLLSRPELAAQLGKNAQAFAGTHLAKERVLGQVEAVYAAAMRSLET